MLLVISLEKVTIRFQSPPAPPSEDAHASILTCKVLHKACQLKELDRVVTSLIPHASLVSEHDCPSQSIAYPARMHVVHSLSGFACLCTSWIASRPASDTFEHW